MKMLRVHLDDTTLDVKATSSQHVQAIRLVHDGVWVGNKLYPPHRIVSIELIEHE